MKRNRFLIMLSLTQFILFLPVAQWARKHPQPLRELVFTHKVQRKRSKFLHEAVQVLSTVVGSAPILNGLVVVAAWLLWRRQWRTEAIFTLVIPWSNALARFLLKEIIHRPRPSPLLVAMSGDKRSKSFPSGHVSSTITFWGWLAALSYLRGRTAWQKSIMGIAALFMLYIGPARVYLGDHWATDVLGGYLFGGGWLSLSLQQYLTWKGSDAGLLD